MLAENFFRHLISRKALFTSAFLFICALSSIAKAQDAILDAIQQNEQEAELLGKDELIRLHEFRAGVEKDAFAVTMKLCMGYRLSIGLPALPPGHEHSGYTAEQSALVWAKVMEQGFWTSLSTIGGYKADDNKVMNIQMWNLRAWYLSMYTSYLINSAGFFYAAQHCLNTVSARDIFYFADAIVLADMAGTGAFDIAGGEAIGGTVLGVRFGLSKIPFVTSFISRSLRLVFRPFHYAGTLLAKQIRRFMPIKIMVGTILVPIAADNIGMRISDNQVIEKAGNDELDRVIKEKPLTPDQLAYMLRYKTMERGFRLLQRVVKDPKDTKVQAKMAQFTSTELTPAKIALYRADESSIDGISADQRTPEQANYLVVLSYMEPLFNGATSSP